MAVALPLTLDSSFSTCGRNEAIAASMTARRCSWSWIAARSCSARRCSVTSSWVDTQPPPGSGSFLASTIAAVAGLHIDLRALAFARRRRELSGNSPRRRRKTARSPCGAQSVRATSSPAARSSAKHCTCPCSDDFAEQCGLARRTSAGLATCCRARSTAGDCAWPCGGAKRRPTPARRHPAPRIAALGRRRSMAEWTKACRSRCGTAGRYWRRAIAIWLMFDAQQLRTKSRTTCAPRQFTATRWEFYAARG